MSDVNASLHVTQCPDICPPRIPVTLSPPSSKMSAQISAFRRVLGFRVKTIRLQLVLGLKVRVYMILGLGLKLFVSV